MPNWPIPFPPLHDTVHMYMSAILWWTWGMSKRMFRKARGGSWYCIYYSGCEHSDTHCMTTMTQIRKCEPQRCCVAINGALFGRCKTWQINILLNAFQITFISYIMDSIHAIYILYPWRLQIKHTSFPRINTHIHIKQNAIVAKDHHLPILNW